MIVVNSKSPTQTANRSKICAHNLPVRHVHVKESKNPETVSEAQLFLDKKQPMVLDIITNGIVHELPARSDDKWSKLERFSLTVLGLTAFC